MITLLISLLGILLTLLFVIGVHEFGHFIAARLLGVKVLRFSIGFGKTLFRWCDKKGTEYAVAAIPLGGYVKMLDETEDIVPEKDLAYAYNRQSIIKKFLIVIAGPLFNLIFAFIIYWVLFIVGFTSIIPIIGTIDPNSIAAKAGMQPQQEIISINNQPTLGWMSVMIRLLEHVGNKDYIKITTKNTTTQQIQNYMLDSTNWQMDELQPNPLESLGIKPYEPKIAPRIGIIFSEDAASVLKVNDTVLAINNKPITTWENLANEIDQHPDTLLHFKIKRGKNIIFIPIKISHERDLLFRKHGYLGISPYVIWPKEMLRENNFKPLPAFVHAWQNIVDFAYLNYFTIGKLLTGKLSIASLGGPITIFQTAGAALNHGLVAFFSFLAFLSIAIGLINTLPIPGLDGGHVFFQVLELIMRRPLSIQMQNFFYRIGFILLLLLISQALINDILRLNF